MLRVNVTAVFFTVQAALSFMQAGASVVLNGSVMAVGGADAYSAYAASKAGVRAMGRCVAAELSPCGIRVNVVVPGITRTPIWNHHGTTPQAMTALEAHLAAQVPLGRLGEAKDIACGVLFLGSDDAAHIQGTELVIDGGATGAPFGAPVYRAPVQS